MIAVGEKDLTHVVGWSVFAALLILTPLYLVKIHNVKSKAQIVLTTLSFPVWVYTIGGPYGRLVSAADSVLYSGRVDVDYSVGDCD